jgi:hypothetical protein
MKPEAAMADKNHLAKDHQKVEQDEIDEVLTTLRRLYQKISSPMIRACLEAARSDLAYLADSGEDFATEDSEEELNFSEDEADAA